MEWEKRKCSYYPGCSLQGTAKDYARSIGLVLDALGIEAVEIPDWNCCGATAAHSIAPKTAVTLAGRNLLSASALPYKELLVPCPLCFNRLKAALFALHGENKGRYDLTLPEGIPQIFDLADFLAQGEFLDRITQGVRHPLKGLEVVCYYGCMAVRPPEVTGAREVEDPQSMDRIVSALGGRPIPWPYKTDCCGASHALARRDLEEELVQKILHKALRSGAKAIVVSCQMCQANLDMYPLRAYKDPAKARALPVLYFTELIGLALGLKGIEQGLKQHFVDPRPLLRELGLLP